MPILRAAGVGVPGGTGSVVGDDDGGLVDGSLVLGAGGLAGGAEGLLVDGSLDGGDGLLVAGGFGTSFSSQVPGTSAIGSNQVAVKVTP